MDELVRRFRRGAEERLALRYDSELRHLAVQYAEVAEGRGESAREIAAALGLNALTLARWRRGAVREAVSSALHEVVVVDSAGGPTLVMPSGVRVEGLSVGELITVLEGLG
jgi:transposase